MIRPEGYPPIDITFQSFCDRLNACFIRPIKDKNQLNELYAEYKETQYRLKIEYVLEKGYETVEEWARWFFSEWNEQETRTYLK